MLNPITGGVVIAALASSVIAGSVAWFARGLVFDHIERPAIIEQQSEICEQITERHAAEAVAAEQLRQFKIGEAAAQQFIIESQAAADDAQARLDLLEMDIEHYVQRVRTSDRETGDDREGVCALDAAALELAGVREAAEPDSPGGR